MRRRAKLLAMTILVATIRIAMAQEIAQSATGSTSASSIPSSAIVPSAGNYKAHFDWNQECETRVRAFIGKRVDILFIGDSITQNWTGPDWGGERRGRRIWAKYYAQRHALNFGVGADATQNVLWRMDTMPIQSLHPKVAVVMIGVNNFPQNDPEQIAAGTRAILDKTQQLYPNTKIILVGMLPNRRAYENTLKVNTLTSMFADNKTVFVLNLAPLFIPNGDNWIGIGPDHLHPNEEGYEIWARAMQPLLNKLLSH